MIREFDGIISAYVTINRPKARIGLGRQFVELLLGGGVLRVNRAGGAGSQTDNQNPKINSLHIPP